MPELKHQNNSVDWSAKIKGSRNY